MTQETTLAPMAPENGALDGGASRGEDVARPSINPGGRRAPRPRGVKRCAALRADGQPCSIRPIRQTEYCLVHSQLPEVKAIVAQARSRGGVASQLAQQPADIEFNLGDPEQIQAAIEATCRAVVRGKIPSSVATAVASLIRVAVAAKAEEVNLQLEAVEAEVEARLRGQRR